ncbi:hypothetical protein KR009_012304, partial [Drosophila setifemur]
YRDSYNIAEVCEALDSMYVKGSSEMDKYLHGFQQSPEAWDIVDEMLFDCKEHPMHVLVFAGSTLRLKIRQEANTLIPELLLTIRDGLTIHLQHAAWLPNARPLVVQLALCLADLGILTSSLTHELAALEVRLRYCPEHILALLEILKMLPEEVATFGAQLNIDHMNRVVNMMRYQGPNVIRVIESYLGREDLGPEGNSECFRVCASWTRRSFIKGNQLMNRVFFKRIVEVLTTPVAEGHEEAADVVVALMEEALLSGSLEMKIFDMIINLEGAFLMSLDKPKMVSSYASIFVSFCETTLKLSRGHERVYELRMQVLELALHVPRFCQWPVVETCLGIWSLLGEELKYKEDSDPEKYIYDDVVDEFLQLVCNQILLPDSVETISPGSPQDVFRVLVAETLNDMGHLVRADSIQQLLNIACNPQNEWVKVEACSFVLINVMNHFPDHKKQLAIDVLNAIIDR